MKGTKETQHSNLDLDWIIKGKEKMKKYIMALFAFICLPTYATTIVATVNGHAVTDADITARTKLMSYQGYTSTNNRRVALQNIIDDNVKLNYASNFGIKPSDKDVDAELKRMGLPTLSENERNIAREAMRANIAWQIIVARTILPMVDVNKSDIAAERAKVARERGLPIEMTLVRLVNVPNEIINKLEKPKNCDDAMRMVENLGGAPQKFNALQYELSADIRDMVADLPILTWSKPVNASILLVCDTKKTKEYGNLDKIIKQNAEYEQAMFMADQQLKQLRRRAVVVIKDERYKL